MTRNHQTKGCVRSLIHRAGLTSLVLLALASPAWADIAFPTDPAGGTCGALGGAALSLGLTLGGIWVVRANRR